MNKNFERQLKLLTNALARAENEKDIPMVQETHKAIQIAVKQIYKERVDVPTVFRVEQIMNDGHANVHGRTNEAHKNNEKLAIQASTGLEIHELFEKAPKPYVEWAEITRKNVQKGKPFAEHVPYEPVRSGLTEFRNQLITDLATPRSVDVFPEREQTNRLRLDATVEAERGFLAKFIDNRRGKKEVREQQKEETLKLFAARVRKQMQKAELKPKKA